MAKEKAKPRKTKTQNFYDRIAEVHNITFKLNGYRQSVSKFLRKLDLNIDKDSKVLDAGSGTGLVTLGLYDAGYKPGMTVALDLSAGRVTQPLRKLKSDKSWYENPSFGKWRLTGIGLTAAQNVGKE